eukprot:jgi/Orpsp1_1/1184558/evm.model.c7180000090024.1
MNFINILLFNIILILCYHQVFADDSIIQILVDKPDALTESNWNVYSTFMDSQDFHINGKSIKVHFNFNSMDSFTNFGKEKYNSYYSSFVEEIQKSDYDMMIVDDRFLFSDYSYIKSDFVVSAAGILDFHENYVDLTKEVKKEELSFHNEDVLSRCYLDDHLYALPFEMDFDVIYGHNANVQKDLEFKTWNDLLTTNQGDNLLSVPYGEK